MPRFFAGFFSSTEKLPIRALHIFVLWGIAVAQPLYDIFSQYADFFVAHHTQSSEIILLTFILSFGLPLLLSVPLFLIWKINSKIAMALYHCVLGALIVLLTLLAVNKFANFPDIFLFFFVALVTIGFLYAYLRYKAVRSLITWAGISIVIFPAQFLIFSAVQQFVFPEEAPEQLSHTVASEVPVVFIVFEELPLVSLLAENNVIDSVRYPNFHKLGQTSHWFRNYTVNATQTKLSLPTILTGRYATHRRVMLVKNYPESLFTLLSPKYKIFGEGLSVELIPKSSPDAQGLRFQMSSGQRIRYMLLDMSIVYLHMIAPKDLAGRLPPVTDNWNNFFDPGASLEYAAPSETDSESKRDPKEYLWKGVAFNYFMDSLGSTDDTAMYFLHSTYAHNPWRHSVSGRMYGDARLPGYLRSKSTVNAVFGFGGGRWSNDEWLVTQGYQRHLLEVGYIDAMLGEIIQRLEELGIFDKSLIIVTSDHGCSFVPGDRNRGTKDTVAGDTMAVPLLIKLPYQKKGTINDRNTEAIDLLPTIADILEIDLAWSVDGQSMFDDSAKERQQKTLIFQNKDGNLERHVVPVAKKIRDLRLQNKLATFGSGHSRPGGIFRIGQYGNLVGRKVTEFPLMAASQDSVIIQFNEADLLADVDLSNPGFIPVRVSGSILNRTPDDDPINLAVEINGAIEATTRSFHEPASGRVEFYAMIAERVLKNGDNSVRFFVISPAADGEVILAPAAVEQ